MRRSQFVFQASLLIVTLVSSQWLIGQTVHPIQGQPQGGDRRGTYYYDEPESQRQWDEGRGITYLYKDPKTYLHNMTVLAHLPVGGLIGDMLTIGGSRYLVTGGVVVDVTNPREPVIINQKSPGGEIAYNQALQKWVLMQANGCCISSQAVVRGKAPHPEADP